jgi:hypothetical protein
MGPMQAEQARTGVERASSSGADALEEALAYLQVGVLSSKDLF